MYLSGGSRSLSNETLIGGISIAFLLALFSFFLTPAVHIPGDYGLCLPSPNQWNIPPFLSWFLNVLIISGVAFLLPLMNRKYNFIQTTDPLLPLAFLILIACNTVITSRLGTPVLLLAVNVLCFYILLETYEKINSTQEFFLIASFLSIGSMVEYSFLMMIPVFVAGGFLMKSIGWREFVAFGFGLIAPYWIVVGMGIVEPSQFRFPIGTPITVQLDLNPQLYRTLVSIGLAALISMIFSFYNSFSLLHGNSRVRSIHLSISIMGYICIISMIGDFNNLLAYSGTIYLWLALEMATLFSTKSFRSPQIWILSIWLLFFILYLIML